jgi:hypothetical protein
LAKTLASLLIDGPCDIRHESVAGTVPVPPATSGAHTTRLAAPFGLSSEFALYSATSHNVFACHETNGLLDDKVV